MINPNTTGPFSESKTKVFSFIENLLINAAISETLKAMDEMNDEGKRLIKQLKDTPEGAQKKALRSDLKLHIDDTKFLLDTIMMNPIEKDA